MTVAALSVLSLASTLFAQENPRELIAGFAESASQALSQGELEKAESDVRQMLGISLDQIGAIHTTLNRYDQAEEAYLQAARYFAISPRPFLGLGVVYLRSGQYDNGIEWTQKILDVNPLHAEARHLMGKLLFMKEEYQRAADELRDAYSLNTLNTGVAYTLALAYLKLRRPEEARRVMGQMTSDRGDSAEMRILFGRAFRETGYLEEALSEFRKAVELDPTARRANYYVGLTLLLKQGTSALDSALDFFQRELEVHPEEYFANLFAGVVLAEQRKDETAVSFLKQAASLKPDNPDPHFFLGRSFTRLGQDERSLKHLEQSVELTSDPSRNNFQLAAAYYMLGRQLMRAGNQTEGEKALKRSQELRQIQAKAEEASIRAHLGPESSAAMGGVDNLTTLLKSSQPAVILDSEEPSPEARKRLEDSLDFYQSTSARAYVQLARIQTEQARFADAAHSLEWAQAWDSSIPDLTTNLALAHTKAGQYERAFEILKKELTSSPDQLKARQLMAGLTFALVEAARSELGLEVVSFLLSQNPDVPELYSLKGQFLSQQGKYSEALQALSKALRINPSLAGIHYARGTVLLRQGKLEEAEKAFDRELNLNPEHVRALYHKAFVRVSLDDFQAARPLLEKVIKLQPDYADAYYQLGKIQIDQGQSIAGLANLETAARLNPLGSHIFYQLSQAYRRAGRMEDAQEAFKRYRELKKSAEEQMLKPLRRGGTEF